LIAAPLGLCAVWALLRASGASKLATAALAGFGIVHAACTGFGYDLACSRWLRGANYDGAAAVAQHVPDDSLVFAQFPDPFYTLVELRERIRIALPLRDRFQDFPRLASFHARHGRGVYAILMPGTWRSLENSDRLEGFLTRPIARIGPFELRELIATERSASLPAPGAPGYSPSFVTETSGVKLVAMAVEKTPSLSTSARPKMTYQGSVVVGQVGTVTPVGDGIVSPAAPALTR
jgi:hypothetical protein